jgi:hypothetical protein
MIHGTDWGAYLGASKEINIPYKTLLDAGLCDFFVCKGDQDNPDNPFMSTMKNQPCRMPGNTAPGRSGSSHPA